MQLLSKSGYLGQELFSCKKSEIYLKQPVNRKLLKRIRNLEFNCRKYSWTLWCLGGHQQFVSSSVSAVAPGCSHVQFCLCPLPSFFFALPLPLCLFPSFVLFLFHLSIYVSAFFTLYELISLKASSLLLLHTG